MPAINQTWCAASKATTGSDAAKYPPSESVPERQRAPESPDVAHPSAAAPPSTIRQDWNVVTIFEPHANDAGSTCVFFCP
jgi:hypothetical protein